MKIRSIFAFVLVCGALSGCVSTGPDGVVMKTTSKKVIAGERTRVGYSWKLGPDCTANGVPQAYILEPPQHGKLVFTTEKNFPVSAQGIYAKCRDKKVDTIAGYYTSAPGYTGKDHAKFRISGQDGRIVDHSLDLDVVK